jgi:hypothetical protein
MSGFAPRVPARGWGPAFAGVGVAFGGSQGLVLELRRGTAAEPDTTIQAYVTRALLRELNSKRQ